MLRRISDDLLKKKTRTIYHDHQWRKEEGTLNLVHWHVDTNDWNIFQNFSKVVRKQLRHIPSAGKNDDLSEMAAEEIVVW